MSCPGAPKEPARSKGILLQICFVGRDIGLLFQFILKVYLIYLLLGYIRLSALHIYHSLFTIFTAIHKWQTHTHTHTHSHIISLSLTQSRYLTRSVTRT